MGSGEAIPLAPPAGTRDLLRPASEARRALGARVVGGFEQLGYELVVTPPFEHAEVLERGLEHLAARDLLRFVEPETGRVALMRPDITPQIARIVATRLRDRPPPWRLCYQGTIIRQRHGRARRHRQVAQAGVEHVGREGPEADAEVVGLAARACERVGLAAFRIELRHVRIGRTLLADAPQWAREPIADAVADKDAAELERRLSAAGVPAPARRRLLGLTELYGDLDVVRRARRSLRAPAIQAALDELTALAEALGERGLEGRLAVDLGELRGRAYYSGPSFALLSEGPGEPIARGGRYDDLLGRFGFPQPATGFAMDLHNLEWALRRAGSPFAPPRRPRLAIERGPGALEVAEALRAAGAVVAEVDDGAGPRGLAFARAWGYDALLAVTGRGLRARRVGDGLDERTRTLSPRDVEAILRFARHPR